MDSTQLHSLRENTYVPPSKGKASDEHVHHHPSLVMLDNQTDTTHHLSCGCSGDSCIAQQAWWEDQKAAEAKCTAARLQGYNSTSNSRVNSTANSPTMLATSGRPGYDRSISSISVNSLSTHSSN